MKLEREESSQLEIGVELHNNEIFSFPYNSHKSFVAIAYSRQDAVRLVSSVRTMQEYAGSDEPVLFNNVENDIWLLRGKGVNLHGFENPFKTGNDSDAIYIATSKLEKGFLLVQYLPPMSRTSHHWHNETEIYSNTGELLIWRNEKEIIPVRGLLTLKPGESHIGFTLDKPAITCIYQTGEELRHEPLKRLSMKFLIEQAHIAGLYKAA